MSSGRYPSSSIMGRGCTAASTLGGAGDAAFRAGPGRREGAPGGSSWSVLVLDEFADVAIDDILDRAVASGLAVGALCIGERDFVLDLAAPGPEFVVALAASLGVRGIGPSTNPKPSTCVQAGRGQAFRTTGRGGNEIHTPVTATELRSSRPVATPGKKEPRDARVPRTRSSTSTSGRPDRRL